MRWTTVGWTTVGWTAVLSLGLWAGCAGAPQANGDPCLHPVAAYLTDAEVQAEDAAQSATVELALRDIASGEARPGARYADYGGAADAWDLPTVLHKHVMPGRRCADYREAFWVDVRTPEARAAAQSLLTPARP